MNENKRLRIAFMGTPEFAATILDAIIKSEHEVVGVVTVADKPAGRGQKLRESEVKMLAMANKLPILQPEKLKDDSFLKDLAAWNADIFVVVAFRMLPEVVWKMPRLGTFNLHASLLPRYRGAAPINWALINGEKETGVTTFFINEQIDTGNILAQEKVSIDENLIAGELYNELMHLGAELTVKTLYRIANGEAKSIPQDEDIAVHSPHAPKLFKTDGKIDWSDSMEKVHNKIRGLSPYPAAWCLLNNVVKNEQLSFKILRSTKVVGTPLDKRLQKDKNGILFPCSDGFISVTELQPEGKRKMNFKEFIAGNNPEEWEII